MYGKHFESMYTGSMFGKPFAVYAVWGYVISHMRQSRKDGKFYVELNPDFLAAMFASTAEEIISTIQVCCDPDPPSRSKAEEGRKLIPEFEGSLHSGPMEFWVVNGKKYKEIRDEEERREYNRKAKRKQRERQASGNVNHVNDVQPKSAMSADPEAETDPEADPEVTAVAVTAEEKPAAVSTAEVPCPKDLKLSADQRSILEMNLGMEPWQIDAMQGAFVLRSISEGTEPRPLSAWLKCMAKAITSDWNNGYRPKKPTEQPKSTDNGGIPYV